jgi:hypothetical protein
VPALVVLPPLPDPVLSVLLNIRSPRSPSFVVVVVVAVAIAAESTSSSIFVVVVVVVVVVVR